MSVLQPFTEPSQWAYGRGYCAAARDTFNNTAGGAEAVAGAVSGSITAGEALGMTVATTAVKITSNVAGWYLVTFVGGASQIDAPEENFILSLYKTPSGGAAALITGATGTVQGVTENAAAIIGVSVSAVVFLASGDAVTLYGENASTDEADVAVTGSLTAVRVR